MDQNRICIPVFAESPDELNGHILRAEAAADVIEVRLDHLSDPAAYEVPISKKSLLLTLRPVREGGKANDDAEERAAIWQKILPQIESRADVMIDLESDLANRFGSFPSRRTVFSHHDLRQVPIEVADLFNDLAKLGGIVKIAYPASDITDTIPLIKLIEISVESGIPFIPAAMGEPGKLLRIMGPALGAYLTFASSETGKQTAPGQIPAAEMEAVYRVRHLDKETQIFGLIAGNTSYSTSPFMHNAAFAERKINAVFIPYQIVNVGDFLQRMVKKETREIGLNFAGFSVTNPHKQAVMPFLDEIDAAAAEIGAVNTIKVDGGKLIGHNTDAQGFIQPLIDLYGELAGTKAAVIGAGGAARACIYMLRKHGAEVTVFARDTSRAAGVAEEFGAAIEELTGSPSLLKGQDIVINATPLGTKGESEGVSPVSADQLSGASLAYDLVYNPAATRFLKEAELAGVRTLGGLDMLVAQGAQQFRLWLDDAAPEEAMAAAVRQRLGI